jgi:hypothetical protein
LPFGKGENHDILRQDSQSSHQESILDPWLFVRYINNTSSINVLKSMGTVVTKKFAPIIITTVETNTFLRM